MDRDNRKGSPVPIPITTPLSSLIYSVLYVQNATVAYLLTTQPPPHSARPAVHPAPARQQGASQGDAIWGVLWAQVVRGDQRPVLRRARRVRCGVRAVCQILDELLDADVPARQEVKCEIRAAMLAQWWLPQYSGLGLRSRESLGEIYSWDVPCWPLLTNARRL